MKTETSEWKLPSSLLTPYDANDKVRPALDSGYFPGYQMHFEKAVSNGAKQLFFWLAGLWVAAWLGGCAAPTPEDSDSWRTAQRPRIAERAEARWKALIAGDFKKAYEHHSSGYRDVVSLQQYERSFGGAVQWHMARVENVEYDDLSSVRVFVVVDYSTSVRGSNYRSTKVMTESWQYKNGEWWYVDIR